MKTHDVQIVDSLSLLSLKVASNVFDLSSGMHHVSIRDQMVRAQLVVRDLKKGDPSLNSLLIVGAGVAGVTAALEAAARGVRTIVVVDVASEPFQLFKNVTQRHVGPYMYEWPSSFSRDQSYPSHGKTPWDKASESRLQWKAASPISAERLRKDLTAELQASLQRFAAAGISLSICTDMSPSHVTELVKTFAHNESARALSRLQGRSPGRASQFPYVGVSWPNKGTLSGMIGPQYVLLAAGMGTETTTLVTTKGYAGANPEAKRFWENDDLLKPGTVDRSLAIFGGGDGALQDALRALTHCTHPLKIIGALEKDPAVRKALDAVSANLLVADRQSRQFGTWTIRNGEYETVDSVCADVATKLARNRLVARAVSRQVVTGAGSVTLFVRGHHFDKAYLLNRFLVHLLIACRRAHETLWKDLIEFDVRFGHHAVHYADLQSSRHRHEVTIESGSPASTSVGHFDAVSVRYGIERGTVPGAQMIQVSPQQSLQRTTLSRVELPFVAERD